MKYDKKDIFEPVDMATWPRADEYIQYTEKWTTISSSINVKISVAKLLPHIKAKGVKFAPAIIWAITRQVNNLKNFRYAIVDGQLGNWDVMHPMYPTLNKDENISFHSVRFKEDFADFLADYAEEQLENADKTSFFANEAPANSFILSILPWMQFEGSMTLKNPKGYYAPIFVVGKFNEEKVLNIMLTVNHATVDAYHLYLLFDGLQKMLDTPEEWCK